jgi:hypothetical protein
MIDRDRFEELAALSVSGESTEAEREELRTALADDPALIDEFLELGATENALRRAVGEPASAADPLPRHLLEGLERTRREARSARLAAEGAAAGAANLTAFKPAESKRRFSPAWLALAACVLAAALIAVFYRPTPSNASRNIAVLAPRGETGFTQPTFVWDTKPGQKYDVWILPPGGSPTDPALFTAKDVEPPLEFARLQPTPLANEETRPTTRLEPGTDYRLLVCIAGAGPVAGIAVPFHTAPDAARATRPPSLEAARALVAQNRPADALMLLTQLPPAERESAEAKALEKDLRARLPKLSSPTSTPAP